MLRQILQLWLFAGLATCGSISLIEKDSPAVVEVQFLRTTRPRTVQERRRSVDRRQSGTIVESLANAITLYLANVTIGTPPQDLALHIDTGSSDTWTLSPISSVCQQYTSICNQVGTYTANKSSTYKYLNSAFSIQYADGTKSQGDYCTDTLSIAGVKLMSAEFGIGYTGTSQEGILGLGYRSNEAIVNTPGQSTYPNLLQVMQSQGFIHSDAYSLYLDDVADMTGSILFGGVDTAKFEGSLETVPILKQNGVYQSIFVGLTGVGLNGKDGSIVNGQAIPVLLDSGSSLMYLPNHITQSIYNEFGAAYDSAEGAGVIDCSMAVASKTVDFTFSSKTISVALSEIIYEVRVQNGRAVCIIGISPAGGSFAVLGDTFLRSAYVVYDLSNNQVGLAQTRFNATGSHIVEISSTIPSASAVANPVSSVTAIPTGGAVVGGLSSAAGGTGVITVLVTSTAGSRGAAATHAPYNAVGALAIAGLGAVFAW